MSGFKRWVVTVSAVLGASIVIGYLWALNSDAYAYARGAVLESRVLSERLGPLRSARLAIPVELSVHQIPGAEDEVTVAMVVVGDAGKESVTLTLVGHDASWRVVRIPAHAGP